MTEDQEKALEEKIQQSLRKLKVMYPNLAKNIDDYEIQNTIGKGGFGEVNLARYTKDGNLYAVKQIFEKRLHGNAFRRFLDEVKTMAKCLDDFLLPISGFTFTAPYSIITPYMPSGCLKDYVSKKSAVKLTPTQLTKIAMGIAHGMIVVHENNIIHRDLKTANILMDEHLLPKICDFGIARFEGIGESNLMTAGIGTSIYMAPELYATRTYSNKVDVYSYAFILWEMSEKKRAFATIKPEKLHEKIYQKGERETFSMQTPRALQTLIKKCWDADPSKRPSFQNIYNAFATGKVSFLGTDESAIKKFAEEIEANRNNLLKEQNRRNDAAQKRVESHVKRVHERKSKEESKKKEAEIKSHSASQSQFQFEKPSPKPSQAPQTHAVKPSVLSGPQNTADNTTTDPVSVLKNYHNVNFNAFVEGYAKTIGIEHFPFFSTVFQNFNDSTPPEVIRFIAKNCNSVMERNPDFIYQFGGSPYYTTIPINSNESVDEIIESFRILFVSAPQIAIHPNLIPQIKKLLDFRAEKMFILYSYAVKRITKLTFTNETLEMLINFAPKVKDTPLGHLLIKLLFYIAAYDSRCKPFIKNNAYNIFVSFTSSTDRQTCISAYNAILNLFENVENPDYNTLTKHLRDDYLAPYVVSLLLRAKGIPRNVELITELMRVGQKIPRTWIVVYQIAFAGANDFPLTAPFWMDNMHSQFECILRLFFVLFHNHENRDRFLSCQWYFEMLIYISRMNNEFFHTVVPSLLTRQTVSISILEQLSNGGFWKTYLQFALDKNTTQLNNNILVLLSWFSLRAGYLKEFDVFVNRLLQLIVDPVLADNSLKTIASLSSYPQFMSVFPHDENSYNYFAALVNNPVYGPPSKTIVENMYKYIQSQYAKGQK